MIFVDKSSNFCYHTQNMKHRGWVLLSGVIWFAIGAMLLYKGLRFISLGILQPTSICKSLSSVLGSAQRAGTILVAFGLLIGFFKGRFVLSKTVRRVVARILSLPLPIRPSQVYHPAYYLLIGAMLMLGLLFRYLPIPIDLRGMIDVAIGSALVNGALLYFRASAAVSPVT